MTYCIFLTLISILLKLIMQLRMFEIEPILVCSLYLNKILNEKIIVSIPFYTRYL